MKTLWKRFNLIILPLVLLCVLLTSSLTLLILYFSDALSWRAVALTGALTVVVMTAAAFMCASASKRAAAVLKEEIDTLNFEHPEQSTVCFELEGVQQELISRNERHASRMEELEILHRRQDTMRSEFTANISHELKTPLTSISGYAEIIKNGIAKQEDINRFSGKIYDESQRLITLVGDIIKLSRLDGKQISEQSERVRLHDVCTAVLSRLDLAAKERNVTFTLSGDDVTVVGYKTLIEEIVFNLCDNAVKYNKDGGSVEIKLRQYVDGAELTVRDSGIGIPKGELDRVFERFYRVDKSHSKEIGGTGLGLSIVKHACRVANAQITIQSEEGQGTTVRVLF